MSKRSTKTNGDDSKKGTNSGQEKPVEASLRTIGGTVYKIQFPVEVPTRKLIPALLSKLGYPATSPSGRRVIYRLEIVYDGGSYRLSDDECCGEHLKRFENAYLVLLPELTAG